MVAIARRRQAEQRLQQPMHGRRGEQIAAAHDVGDPLQRVVDDDGQMIGRGGSLPRSTTSPQAAARRRPRPLVALAEFAPSRARPARRAARGPCRAAGGRLAARQSLARSRAAEATQLPRWSGAPSGSRAGGGARRPSAARAETGIDEPGASSRPSARGVVVDVFALAARRAVEDDAEPGQIFADRLLEFALAAGGVDVLIAQEQRPPASRRAARS